MRSMEAGLLAYDTVLVADEAHLSRQLLETAQQVDRIESIPNHRSFDSYEEDKRKLSSYLSSEFKIPSDDFQMRFVGTATSTKLSTAHNEERTYDYRLYLASVIRIPDAWDAEGEFAIESKKCKWMTVDEMLNDRKIYAINRDVIQMLKDLI